MFLITITMFINTASATMNVVIITDPTGQNPNGAAAASISWAENMFQSTFIYSKVNHFCVLSGGEGNETGRLEATVQALKLLESGATPATASAAADSYTGERLVVGSPTMGAAVSGSFTADLVVVSTNGTITITPMSTTSGGTLVLPAGDKGAIIHLRNSVGNPQYGTADTVRLQLAEMIGEMIRDGYPATYILGQTIKYESINAGEKHGGGGLNLVSGISTGDMFTPTTINTTGYSMNEPYSKVSVNGWSIGYPAAENYQTSPVDGSALTTVYAYDALTSAITVSSNTTSVSVYGSDAPGVSETTQDVVQASVKKHGLNSVSIAKSINSAINSGLIIGVNYVEPDNINIVSSQNAGGVYYSSLTDDRSAPAWNLPISSSIIDLLGSMQTAIGLILVILVLFRSTLIKSFMKR
jgi:hypothetical protein